MSLLHDVDMRLLPRDTPGVAWRSLSSHDAPELAALVARIEARDNPPYRTSADEITEMLDPAAEWIGTVAVATVGVDRGRMVAFAHLELRHNATPELLCQGGVDPHFRRLGIGAAIVQWQTEVGQSLQGTHHLGNVSIVMSVDPNHEELEEHLKAHGYRWSRSLSEMRAELQTLPRIPVHDTTIVLEPWSPAWDDTILQTVNAAAHRAGAEPMSAEEWAKGRSAFAPEWSFIAYDARGDRPRLAGFVLASRYEQDWAVLGWKEGYIDQLTVFEEWRHLGVAESLIVESMKAQKAAGMERIGTGVSSDHHTDAHSVYDFLGFREVGQIRLYTLGF